ncbi:MAG: cytochrome c oxidase subunit II [Actinomycetota bacterium]|nr:cytochrome c oxidase subunit II [Actinomycetota bacterium]
MRRIRLLLAPLTLLLGACAEYAPYDSLDPAGPVARRIYELNIPVFWIATAIFVLVEGALVVFMIVFRDKKGRGLPRQTHGNTALEITWTIIPALILAYIGFATVKTIFQLRAVPPGAMPITVEANQWWWEFRYPEQGIVTANEMHIPVDRPVHLTLESVDVIHSFWVPRLAGKQDVVPGRTHQLSFTAVEPDIYFGECAEFCGISHALMRLRVIAQTEQDFQAWVEGQQQQAREPTEALARQGQEIFLAGQCVQCHTIQGTPADGEVGPDLTHFASRNTLAAAILENTPENLAAWLRNPPEIKPGAKMPNLGLSPEDINALVAYLESLR